MLLSWILKLISCLPVLAFLYDGHIQKDMSKAWKHIFGFVLFCIVGYIAAMCLGCWITLVVPVVLVLLVLPKR